MQVSGELHASTTLRPDKYFRYTHWTGDWTGPRSYL